jgi:hypothetical protein
MRMARGRGGQRVRNERAFSKTEKTTSDVMVKTGIDKLRKQVERRCK